jgi:preprotein translocase subunit SecA
MRTKSRLKGYLPLLQKIKAKGAELEFATTGWLKQKAQHLKEQAEKGIPTTELLTETYALCCEVAQRVLHMRPFDVQIATAIAMHQGKLVEMQTGERKTLAAVMPACLFGLSGRGVHVLTFNDYLAAQDAR